MSLKLRSQIRTPKGLQIIRKAERSLINERVKNINNTINMLNIQRDTCMNTLKQNIGEDLMEECSNFINERREARHWKTMAQQKRKLESLWHKSCIDIGDHSNTLYSGSNNTTESKDNSS